MAAQKRLSIRALAKEVGLDEKMVRKHRDNGAPVDSVEAFQEWYGRSVGSKRGDRSKSKTVEEGSLHEQKLQEDLLLTRAKRKREELALERDAGTLIDRGEAIQREVRIATTFRQLIEQIPRANAEALADIDDARTMELELSKLLEAVLWEVSQMLQKPSSLKNDSP